MHESWPKQRAWPAAGWATALMLACGPSADPETATRLLADARQESRDFNFDLARAHLEQALTLAEPETELHEELEYELHYRLPLAEGLRLLQEHDAEALADRLQMLDSWVADHPTRLREARAVEDLRRSSQALGQALSLRLRGQLREIRVLLQAAYWEREAYPEDQEAFAELLESSGMGAGLTLVSYERVGDLGYEAVLLDSATGRHVRPEPEEGR